MTAKTSSDRDYGEPFVIAAVPLMKEYTVKLEDLVRKAESIRHLLLNTPPDGDHQKRNAQLRLSHLRERASHLSSAVNELGRRVSQMIEHGQLDSELDRVELKLRLAELENATIAAKRIDTRLP